MSLLLDTNVISDFVRGQQDVHRRLLQCAPADIYVSSVTVMEIEYGLARNPPRARRIEPVIAQLLKTVNVLAYDASDARESGNVRAELATTGQPIGLCDAMIAGVARCRNLTLVTNNVREFARVANLRWVNWRDSDLPI